MRPRFSGGPPHSCSVRQGRDLCGAPRHPRDNRQGDLLEGAIQGLNAGSGIIACCGNARLEPLGRDNSIVLFVDELDIDVYDGVRAASCGLHLEVANFNGER